jgi:hypothetical protein
MPGAPIPPLSVILSWPAANTINPETISDFWWIWIVITMVIATITVIIRIWIKQRIQGGFSSDDYFMIFGYLAQISMSITACLTITIYKWDRHIWDAVPFLSQIVQGRKATFVLLICSLLANMGVKISILLFIKRMIIRTSRRWLYWTIWLSIIFVAVTNMTYLILIWIECTPLNAWWNQIDIYWALSHNFTCWGEAASTISSGAFNLYHDFMVATLPIFVLWDLQIPISKKINIMALFALGYL